MGKAADMERSRAYMSKINNFRVCTSKRNILLYLPLFFCGAPSGRTRWNGQLDGRLAVMYVDNTRES
jgi:hypothetical protein